jgi:hypothetical protein
MTFKKKMTEVNKICVVLQTSRVWKIFYMLLWKLPSLVIQPETSRKSIWNCCYMWTESLKNLWEGKQVQYLLQMGNQINPLNPELNPIC